MRIGRCSGLLALALAGVVARGAQAQPTDQGRQPVRPIALADALDYARLHYPSVRAALADKIAAEKDVDVARAAYLPQVNLLWQINRSTVNNITGVLLPQSVMPSISGPVLPETGQSAWNSGVGAQVVWRPFDFGYRAARVEGARDAADAAVQGEALTELDVVAATANAYFNLAAAEALVAASQANLARLQAFAGSVHVLVDNKLRAGVEGEQADAAEALARVALVSAEANVATQRATLAKLVGRSAEQTEVDPRLAGLAPPQESVAGATAPQSHPLARQEAARVEQQSALLKAIGRSFAPQFDVVGAAWTRGGGKTAAGAYRGGSSGLAPDVENWAVGVQLSLPLGSYPALRSQEQAQRARLQSERARYDQALADVAERSAQARAGLASAQAIAGIIPTALAAAKRGEEQQRARFRSGLATTVDVAAAEAALAQAESQDAIARLNVWRALAALAAAGGDLAPFEKIAGASR